MLCTLRKILMILPKFVMYIISILEIGVKLLHLQPDCIESVILLWDNVYAFTTGENVRERSMSQFKRVVNRRLCVKGYYQNNYYINDNTPWERNARSSLFQSIIVTNI